MLLVRRRNPPDAGLWGFPGGHVEPGETALNAAARELHEETGVLAKPLSYLDNVDVIEHAPDGSLRFHFLLTAVLCEYVSGAPTAGDDALDAAWLPVADVLSGQLSQSENVAEILQQAMEQTARRAGSRRSTTC